MLEKLWKAFEDDREEWLWVAEECGTGWERWKKELGKVRNLQMRRAGVAMEGVETVLAEFEMGFDGFLSVLEVCSVLHGVSEKCG